MPHYPLRRAGDRAPVRAAALPRDRFTLLLAGPSEHMRGWADFATARKADPKGGREYQAGYAEARNCAIDIYSAQAAEHQVTS
jgi:hypothetical protein